jgi:hypothetical protein
MRPASRRHSLWGTPGWVAARLKKKGSDGAGFAGGAGGGDPPL